MERLRLERIGVRDSSDDDNATALERPTEIALRLAAQDQDAHVRANARAALGELSGGMGLGTRCWRLRSDDAENH